MLSIISWIVFGLIVGIIARLLVPGPQSLGLLGTILLGIAGSFLGGFIVYLIAGGSMVQSVGWIGSILGAIALVLLGQRMRTRRFT